MQDFGLPPLPSSSLCLPICHPFLFSNTHTRAEPRTTRGERKLRHGFDCGPICVAAKPCVSSNPPAAPLEEGEGGWQSRDTHEHSTPALRHAWNHHGHARNTIRLHGGGCWSAGLQSWGSSQPAINHQSPKPGQAKPASWPAAKERVRTVSFPPLTPPLSGWWAKAQSHRHTLFPFGLDLSSIVFLLGLFGVQAYARAYGGCNSMTDANDPTLCSISNFVLPA